MQFKKAVGESDVVLNTIDNVIEKTSSQKDTFNYNAVLSNRLGKATKEYSLDAIKLAIPHTYKNIYTHTNISTCTEWGNPYLRGKLSSEYNIFTKVYMLF